MFVFYCHFHIIIELISFCPNTELIRSPPLFMPTIAMAAVLLGRGCRRVRPASGLLSLLSVCDAECVSASEGSGCSAGCMRGPGKAAAWHFHERITCAQTHLSRLLRCHCVSCDCPLFSLGSGALRAASLEAQLLVDCRLHSGLLACGAASNVLTDRATEAKAEWAWALGWLLRTCCSLLTTVCIFSCLCFV